MLRTRPRDNGKQAHDPHLCERWSEDVCSLANGEAQQLLRTPLDIYRWCLLGFRAFFVFFTVLKKGGGLSEIRGKQVAVLPSHQTPV